MDNFKVNDIQAALTSPIDNKQQVQQSENFKFTLISRIAESELQEKLSAMMAAAILEFSTFMADTSGACDRTAS